MGMPGHNGVWSVRHQLPFLSREYAVMQLVVEVQPFVDLVQIGETLVHRLQVWVMLETSCHIVDQRRLRQDRRRKLTLNNPILVSRRLDLECQPVNVIVHCSYTVSLPLALGGDGNEDTLPHRVQ